MEDIDLKPILYEANTVDFNNNGLGALTEVMFSQVTEERNGIFELSIVYPMSGKLYDRISEHMLLKVKPNKVDDPHVFRIYGLQIDSIAQTVSIDASTKSNELVNNLVKDLAIENTTPQVALDLMKQFLVLPTDYDFISDITSTNSTHWTNRNPLNCIAGEEGSLVDVFGGEIKRGNRTIWLYANRGVDNPNIIRHGKNLQGFTVEYSTKGMTTAILPYFNEKIEESSETQMVYGDIVYSQYANNYPFLYLVAMDYSSEEEVTDLATLNTKASQYFTEHNGIDRPSMSATVDMQDLSDSSEYKRFKSLEHIQLCDAVTVYSKKHKVNLKAKVTKIIFDTLLEKNVSLELGSIRTSLTDSIKQGYTETIQDLQQNIYQTIETAANGKNRVFRGVEEPITGMIQNDVWYKPVNDGEIEMYVFDGAIWNKEAYSADSLGGTVNFANINAINLNLDALTTATITGANMWLNLVTGEMQFTNPDTGDLMTLKQGRLQYQTGDSIYYQYYDANGLTVRPSDGNTGDGLNTGMTLIGNKTYFDFLKKGSINDYDARIIFNETDLPDGLQIRNTLGGIYLRLASSIPVRIQDNYVSFVTGENSTTFQVDGLLRSGHIAQNTTSATSNVHIRSDGVMFTIGSASKYKSDIQMLENEVEYSKRILDLHPKSWIDKGEQERADVRGRYYGVIAEDVEALGLQEYTTKNKDGELESVQYDRLWTLLLPVVREQESEIKNLKQELADLKTLRAEKGVI